MKHVHHIVVYTDDSYFQVCWKCIVGKNSECVYESVAESKTSNLTYGILMLQCVNIVLAIETDRQEHST